MIGGAGHSDKSEGTEVKQSFAKIREYIEKNTYLHICFSIGFSQVGSPFPQQSPDFMWSESDCQEGSWAAMGPGVGGLHDGRDLRYLEYSPCYCRHLPA